MGICHDAALARRTIACLLVYAFLALANGEQFLEGLSHEDILKLPLAYAGEQFPDGRTTDEVIKEAKAGNAAPPMDDDQVLAELDMVMEKQQYVQTYQESSYAGGGMKSEYYRWPKAIIPYQISSSFSGGRDKFIYSAMKEWMEKTCVVFTPAGSSKHKEAGHNHKITIFSGGGCYSTVGYTHRDHKVSLSLRGCAYHGTALHELGHTIGLHHEQSRIDRDDALKINYKNVQRTNAYNFHKQTDSDPFGVKYDFCSIMHYGNTAFSSNGKFSILTRDQRYQFSIGNPGSPGHRNSLTFTDAKIVNLMYKCNSHCDKTIPCKSPCYINHKCQCECPKPEDECPKKPCEDYYSNPDQCLVWKNQGRCHTGNSWMTRNCAKSCGFCAEAIRDLGSDLIDGGETGGGGQATNAPPTIKPATQKPATQKPVTANPGPTDAPSNKLGPNCKDRQANCGAFVEFYRGNCFTDSSEFLRPMCPKSCNICLPCGDSDPKCQKWAKLGYCYGKGLNDQHIYMADNCKRACGYCV